MPLIRSIHRLILRKAIILGQPLLIHLQKSFPRSRSTTKHLGLSLTGFPSRRISALGLIRISSKHLRQSIELGVKPHNGLVLCSCSVKTVWSNLYSWSCCRLRDTDGRVGIVAWSYRVAMLHLLNLTRNSESVLGSNALADPSRLYLPRVLLEALTSGYCGKALYTLLQWYYGIVDVYIDDERLGLHSSKYVT
jgi:hypothetical protein